MLSVLLALALVGAPEVPASELALEICHQFESKKAVANCKAGALPGNDWASNAVWSASFDLPGCPVAHGMIAVYMFEVDRLRAMDYLQNPEKKMGPWHLSWERKGAIINLPRDLDHDRAAAVISAYAVLEKERVDAEMKAIDERYGEPRAPRSRPTH
jgi:hypothetical protein